MTTKSTVEEIRARFDNDVERFTCLETGQTAIPDAAVMLELVARAAAATAPHACDLLDIGCGAGNYSLKVLGALPNLNVTLIDLSQPMLDRAVERVSARTNGKITTIQQDVRDLELESASRDVIVAAAVLHHLRTDDEWQTVFEKFYSWLRPGGSVWIADMIQYNDPNIRKMMWDRYGDYLVSFKDEAYRDHVFEYIEYEDSPQSLMYQLSLLQQVGFDEPVVLHHSYCGSAFGAVKSFGQAATQR